MDVLCLVASDPSLSKESGRYLLLGQRVSKSLETINKLAVKEIYC